MASSSSVLAVLELDAASDAECLKLEAGLLTFLSLYLLLRKLFRSTPVPDIGERLDGARHNANGTSLSLPRPRSLELQAAITWLGGHYSAIVAPNLGAK